MKEITIDKIKLIKSIASIDCDNIIKQYNHCLSLDSIKLPINDKNNKSNIRYTSTRSRGLEYCYLDTIFSSIIMNELSNKLLNKTEIRFDGHINNICMPVFKYNDGGIIKAHRDVDKTKKQFVYPNYIAVVMLSQRGVDFNEGRLYINDKATVSEDGKEVSNDNESDRYYPNLNKGDIFIFDNTKYIHGVTETIVNKNQIGRFTTSIRTL